LDENGLYKNRLSTSRYADEVIWAGYFRGDLQFFNRRLKLVGGLRGEQTNVTAQGLLTDPTRNFQRDSQGNIVHAANGSPVLIAPTTDALAVSKLTLVDRGAHVEKEYLRWFPSLNASFNLRDNLILRGAYYWSVGRPDFNQYAGGITLPNADSVPSPSNRITLNNAAIKAWKAETYKIGIEHYFERVGLVSIGWFRRDFKNFFGSVVFTPTAEFMDLYGLDSTYNKYDVSTQYNIPDVVRMQGIDFSYKQALTFLPNWASGVQVFANGNSLRATGSATALSNFDGYTPWTASWGVSLTRPKYSLRTNWSYRGRARQPPFTGLGIEPGTYRWKSKKMVIDVTGEYNLTRRFTLFAALRNLDDATDDVRAKGPNTPDIAGLREREDFGALWTFGVKGSF
jgi:iron complex outermembrane receptor protein